VNNSSELYQPTGHFFTQLYELNNLKYEILFTLSFVQLVQAFSEDPKHYKQPSVHIVQILFNEK
jgi:hypothetical protein